MIDYLIELCGELKKAYPGAYVDTLAYRKDQTEIPPRLDALPDNLIITFAPIDDNFAVTMDHPSNLDTLKNLRDWCKIAKNVRVWYYPNTYGCEPPPGNLQRLVKDTQLIHQAGATGTYYEQDAGGVKLGYNFSELQTWLLLKLFQNPYQDTDKLIREFTDFYYGPAAPMMRGYINELEELHLAMTTPLPWNASLSMYNYLTPSRIIAWEAVFDRMDSLGSLTPMQRDNVRTARVSLDMVMLDKWREVLKDTEGTKLTVQELIQRIKDGFEIAARKRTPASSPKLAAQRKGMEGAIASMEMKALIEPKPLPEPFRSLPSESVRRLYPFQPSANREKDDDAACGVALAGSRNEVPVKLGIYDWISKKYLLASAISKEDIRPDAYHIYKVGRSVLTPNCALWITDGWVVVLHLEEFYVTGYPFIKWDIYASLKFEGPQYGSHDAGKADKIFCDQVVLVKADDN